MARESTQHKLDRVRSPRVQITYDVEIGGAIELKELPFVVGVLGDFTGQPEKPLAKLKERKFVEVNPDNFDTVLDGMKPHLAFSVENKLSEEPDAPNLKVDLQVQQDGRFRAAERGPPGETVEGTAGPANAAVRSSRNSANQRPARARSLLETVNNTEKLNKLRDELGKGKGDESNG